MEQDRITPKPVDKLIVSFGYFMFLPFFVTTIAGLTLILSSSFETLNNILLGLCISSFVSILAIIITQMFNLTYPESRIELVQKWVVRAVNLTSVIILIFIIIEFLFDAILTIIWRRSAWHSGSVHQGTMKICISACFYLGTLYFMASLIQFCFGISPFWAKDD